MTIDPIVSPSSPDLLIVGAGPAGLACAIAAARRGFQVEIADSRKPPIDKACGEGLLPDALTALDQLGIPTERLQPLGLPFRGIRFLQSRSTCTDPLTTEALFPSGYGLGIRRTELHRLLIDQAAALGVRFRWQTVVTRIAGNHVHTNQGIISSRWIIGADGHQSKVRAIARLEDSSATRPRIGLRQHYSIAPWTNLVEVYWANHCQAYVTPVSSDEICVAFIASSKFSDAGQALSLFPQLQRRLASSRPSDTPRGAITLNRRLRRVTSNNIALIGDASGSVDAITGEGLALCFRQALALAEALEANNLALYNRAHIALHRTPRLMSRAMLLMDHHPFALTRAFNAFDRKPDFFSRLLNLHISHTPLRLLGSGGLLASLACLLTP